VAARAPVRAAERGVVPYFEAMTVIPKTTMPMNAAAATIASVP
jgi:hypothetical protein